MDSPVTFCDVNILPFIPLFKRRQIRFLGPVDVLHGPVREVILWISNFTVYNNSGDLLLLKDKILSSHFTVKRKEEIFNEVLFLLFVFSLRLFWFSLDIVIPCYILFTDG